MEYRKRLRCLLLAALLAGATASLASAQSNDRLDELLSQFPARLDSSVYLILSSVTFIPETATPDQAFQAAVSTGLVAKDQKPGDPVTLQELAYLVMKTQKFPGGLEWRLLPTPRGAYRELAYHNLINTAEGPDRVLAGDEVVRTLNDVIEFKRSHP